MRMEDIERALHQLPRVGASRGFRERVLRRLDEEPRQTARRWQPLALVAAAAALALVVGMGVAELGEQRRERLARQRVEHLRHEMRDLTTELGELRSIALAAQPVIGIETEGEEDYLVDLRALARPAVSDAAFESARDAYTVPVVYADMPQ